MAADVLDPDATLAVEQAGAVEDGEPADVAGPAEVIPQEQKHVRCGEAFQSGCDHDVTLLLVPRAFPSFSEGPTLTRHPTTGICRSSDEVDFVVVGVPKRDSRRSGFLLRDLCFDAALARSLLTPHSPHTWPDPHRLKIEILYDSDRRQLRPTYLLELRSFQAQHT
jgi:hypothetical protein